MNADLETAVFTVASKAVLDEYPDALVISEYNPSPSKLPCVLIVEIDNRVYKRRSTIVLENASSVTYQVDVFTNTPGKKKSTAKQIMAVVDKAFTGMGFTRTMCSQIQDFIDATVYRMTARYEAVADPDFMIFSE